MLQVIIMIILEATIVVIITITVIMTTKTATITTVVIIRMVIINASSSSRKACPVCSPWWIRRILLRTTSRCGPTLASLCLQLIGMATHGSLVKVGMLLLVAGPATCSLLASDTSQKTCPCFPSFVLLDADK